MMNIKEAKKELIRVGCSKAEGDALRFMYANMLAFEQGLSVEANSIDWPIPGLYKELGEVPDSGIYRKVQLMREEFGAAIGLK
jgi:hypothetical protein